MAKPTHFSSVHDWVKAQFKFSVSDAKSLNAQTLSMAGKILLDVQPVSPAGLMGLKAGDILYALNGGVFDIDDLEKTFRPRSFGRSFSFDFFRPATRQKIRIKGPTFPFGARFGQTEESFIVELRNGSPDPSDTYEFWNTGNTAALAAFLPAFEAFNIRIIRQKGAPFDGPLPQAMPYNTELVSDGAVWEGHFTWLALCAAHAGQWDRARFVLKYVEDHFEKSGDGGMVSMFAAMAYTRSMLAEHDGQLELAAQHIEHAIEMSPETEVLYRRLSKLTGSEVARPASPLIGAKLDYNLPKQDPANRFNQPVGQTALRESVEALKSGEFILVCMMSAYRTNGPYVEGFRRAQLPLSRLRNIFKEVHVITSWDKATSRDLAWPIMEPEMEKWGINVSVLFDETASVGEELALISSPTNLILDHTGTIMSEGWLGDDTALWSVL